MCKEDGRGNCACAAACAAATAVVRSGQARPGQVRYIVGIIGFVDVVLPTYLPTYLGLHYSLPCVYLMCIHVVPFECECGLEYLSTVPVDTSYLTFTRPWVPTVPTELEELSFPYRDESAT